MSLSQLVDKSGSYLNLYRLRKRLLGRIQAVQLACGNYNISNMFTQII